MKYNYVSYWMTMTVGLGVYSVMCYWRKFPRLIHSQAAGDLRVCALWFCKVLTCHYAASWLGTGTCSWDVLCSSLAVAGVCVLPQRHGDLSGEGQFRVHLLCLSKYYTTLWSGGHHGAGANSGFPACNAGCARLRWCA